MLYLFSLKFNRKLAGTLTTYATQSSEVLNNEGVATATPKKPTPLNETFGHHSVKSVNALVPGKKPKAGEGGRDAYDRWFLNGYDQNNKDCFFAAALGFYPGRRLKDASFSVVYKGVQHNVRASVALTLEEWPVMGDTDGTLVSTTVGPIQIIIVEPLQKVQLIVNEVGGIKANVTFDARYEAFLEPLYDQTFPGLGSFQYERMTQLVEWNGDIEIPEAKLSVGSWWGIRDRSWGLRPHPSADKSASSNLQRNKILGSAAGRGILNKVCHKWRRPEGGEKGGGEKQEGGADNDCMRLVEEK